jgi:hypothetical protein
LPAVRAVSKHHWLIIACDACDTVVDLEIAREARGDAVGVIEKLPLNLL